MVRPVKPVPSVRFVNGQDKALVKLLALGCTVSVPVESMVLAEGKEIASPVSVMLLELAVTALPAFLPTVLLTSLTPFVLPSRVMAPDAASKSATMYIPASVPVLAWPVMLMPPEPVTLKVPS